MNVLNKYVFDWIWWLILILYPFFLFSTTTLAVSSSLLWIFSSFSFNHNYLNESISQNKTIFWLISLLIGFFMIELETRRISRSLKWNDMKQSDHWVRGGCITNCWLHFCCAGCSAD